jgi:hypothetical protein
MSRWPAFLLVVSAPLAAQSISVTSPTSGQSVSGTSFTLSISYSGLASLYSVQYLINGEPGANYNANDTMKCAACPAPAYNLNWNSYYADNGPAWIKAVARDAQGNVLATSAPVSFTMANPLPHPPSYLAATYTCDGGACPAPGAPPNWAFGSSHTIQVTWTGTNNTASKLIYLFIDGLNVASNTTTATSYTINYKVGGTSPRLFPYNAVEYNHLANFVIRTDLPMAGAGTEWRAGVCITEFQVNLTGSGPVELTTSPGKELFLTPGGASATLTPKIRNSDLSLSNGTSYTFSSSDTSRCTVTSPGGVVTPVGEGMCTVSITESSTGLTEAVYVYIFSAATSGVAHFCNNGSVTSGTCAGGDAWIGSIFGSGDSNAGSIMDDHVFTADKYVAAALELGITGVEPQIFDRLPNSGESQSAYHAHLQAHIAPWQTLLSNHPGLRFSITTDNAIGLHNKVYQTVSGLGSAWSPPSFVDALQQWASTGSAILAHGPDEVIGKLGACPMCQPTIGGTMAELVPLTWTSLVSDGAGNCTMNVSSAGQSFIPGASNYFGLQGSTTPELNSTPATATATQTGGVVNSTITVTNGGHGYTVAPYCIIVDSAGTGATCTATMANGTVTGITRGSGGSGYTSGLTVSLTPPYFLFTSQSSTVDAFACPGVPAGTHTAANDPGLRWEPNSDLWTATPSSVAGQSGNGPTGLCWVAQACPAPANGPYVDYLHANAFSSVVSMAHSASPGLKISWPPAANTLIPAFAYNWLGGFSPSDYNMVYTTPDSGTADYLPHTSSGIGSRTQIGSIRGAWTGLNHSAPIFTLAGPQYTGWGLEGYQVNLSSCSNGTCITTADHKVRNIIDADTRIKITGTGTAMDDGWYIARAPDSTHLFLYGKPTFVAAQTVWQTDGTGTATFDDGSTFTLLNIGPAISGNYAIGITVQSNSDPSCNIWKKVGHTFTVSGSGAWSNYTGKTFYYGAYFNGHAATCPAGGSSVGYVQQVPPVSSSGGVGYINANNGYIRGITYPLQTTGQDFGPIAFFLNAVASAIILRSCGNTFYNSTVYQDGFDPVTNSFIAGNSTNGIFNNIVPPYDYLGTGLHPFYDVGGSKISFESAAAGTRLNNRLAKFLYQPSLPSPDYGAMMDCAAHDGHATVGNLLYCLYYGNGPWRRTFDLASYVIAGQSIIKLYGHWYDVRVTTLPPGTTSDTVDGDGDTFVAYIFSTNTAVELMSPAPAVHQPITEEFPNAAKVVARCAYSEWLLDNTPALVFDLGTGSGTLGVDPAIGKSYCRLQYLDASGRVLSTGAVQNF